MKIDHRKACSTDVSIVYGFIKAIAQFECEPESVQTNEELITAQLRAEHSPFCDIVFVNDHPAGMAVCYFSYSTWTGKRRIHLEDLYTNPKYRRLGQAKGLIRRLCAIAQDTGCARMVWNVLFWNQQAIQLYEYIGAKPLSEWLGYRMSIDEIEAFLTD